MESKLQPDARKVNTNNNTTFEDLDVVSLLGLCVNNQIVADGRIYPSRRANQKQIIWQFYSQETIIRKN